MLIEFKSEGGIAHFPGLSQPIRIDTARIADSESSHLAALVTAARFFDLPQTVGLPPPGSADYRKYTITVTDGPVQRSVQVYDPIQSHELRALVDYLKSARRRQP